MTSSLGKAIEEFTDKDFMREFTLSSWKVELDKSTAKNKVDYQIGASALVMMEVYLGIMVTVHSEGLIDPTFGISVVVYALATLYTLFESTESTLCLMSVSTFTTIKFACFALIYSFIEYEAKLLSGEYSFMALILVLCFDATYSYYKMASKKNFRSQHKEYRMQDMISLSFAFNDWKKS